MGSHNPPLIIQGAYSEHFQSLQKNGIEILKQDNFYERGDIIHKIRRLQQETQKRRKDQQMRRELEEKKEEERRKQILDERRRHLQEVTEKYQRLGRKRFRLLTATTSPLLSRAGTSLEDSMSTMIRGDGTTSALPLSNVTRFEMSRGNSADVISRMQEHGLPVTNNSGLPQTSDAALINEYKKATGNPAMLSALNPPSTTQTVISNNNSNLNSAALSSYSAQFQAVRANHQRLLEQLGLKSNNDVIAATTVTPSSSNKTTSELQQPSTVNGKIIDSSLSSTGNRIHIDATSAKAAVLNGGGLQVQPQPQQQLNSRPSSASYPSQNGNNNNMNEANFNKTTGSVVTGLPTVVATAATVQEAMQASYSLNSRATVLKPLSAAPVQQQTLQQSVLFLQSNGVISSSSRSSSSHQNAQGGGNNTGAGSNSHQFGTIIHMQQQAVAPQIRSEPAQVQDQTQPVLKLTSIETTSQIKTQQTVVPSQTVAPMVPQAPKERPIGLVRPSSASSVKRDDQPQVSISLEDSLNFDSRSEKKQQISEQINQTQPQQLGSIKMVTTPQDEISAAKQVFLTAVPSVPDVLRVFNATAPDGATLMAQINEMKNAPSIQNHSKTNSAISLNFQIPSGVQSSKQMDETADLNNGGSNNVQQQAQKAPISINNKPNINNVAYLQPNNNNNSNEQQLQTANSNSTPKQQNSNTSTGGNRPPTGRTGVAIPPETAYTDLTRPVNKYSTFNDPNSQHIGLSLIKRYNSDSALADHQQAAVNSQQRQYEQQAINPQLMNYQRAETAPESGTASQLGSTTPTPGGRTIKSILKRSPSLERTNLGSGGQYNNQYGGSPSSVQLNNTIQQIQQQQSGAKSVTFGHVHIADLTAEGPISVRDSIELTKFKQSPDDIVKGKRKVLFAVEDNEDQAPQQTQQTKASNNSGSQIIRVEMGGRSTPRNAPPSSPVIGGLQRGNQNNNANNIASLYANSLQRAMTSVGGRPQNSNQQQQQQQQQHYPANMAMDGSSPHAVPVDHAPSDAEINWLWEKVRSCLNRSQSATGRPQQQGVSTTLPNSYANMSRTGSAPVNNNNINNNNTNQLLSPASPSSRLLSQGSHKFYIDGSSINLATGAQIYVANNNNNNNVAQSHQIRAPTQSNSSPLKALIATGVNINPTTRNNGGNHNGGDLSQSTMAFLAAEQLVAGGLSESIIHDAIDQIQAQNRQPAAHLTMTQQTQLQPVSQQYQTAAGNGRSALSMEEDQIMKSLDRINDRLQYLEVTGQSAATQNNKASPSVSQPYNTSSGSNTIGSAGEVAPLQPTLAYMPAMLPPQPRQSSASRRFLHNQQSPSFANPR